MQLTRFTDYSIRVLIYLAQHPDRLCTANEVATYHGISQNHLVKVVHNLARLKYIESLKGKGGGIRLLKRPAEINLRNLIIQLEPNMFLVECFDRENNTCRIAQSCGLKGILSESMHAFMESLKKYSLADIV